MPVLLVSQLGVAPAQAQTAPAKIREGYTLLGKGLVKDAIATFQQAVAQYPQSIEAKLGLAIAYRRAGKDADAWRLYQQVLAQDPNNLLALKTVGILGSYRPEWQTTGIAALNRLLELKPGDLDTLTQRALLYSYQGRLTESLADYQIVLQRNPSPETVLNAAQVYAFTKNYASALTLFNRYRATNRSIPPSATIAYARTLRATGNINQAIQILQSQLPKKFDATAIPLLSELSQTYLANGQVNEAIAVLQSLQGRSDSQLALARALNEIGQQQNLPVYSAQAALLYRQVLAQQPNAPVNLVREVADVLSAVPSEKAYALQLYRWLAQQQPNDRVLAIQELALANQLGLLSRNDLRQRLQMLLQPFPSDPAQQAAIAQALIRIEPDPELLPIYQALIQAGVNEPFLNLRLAQILVERNDFAGATAALDAYRSTPQGAQDAAQELLLAEIDRRQGNLEASAQRYQALLSRNLTDIEVNNAALQGLAGVRLIQGRTDQALALYDQLLARNPQDLRLQLGWASIAYQAKRIPLAQAEAVLNAWLQSRPATDTPPELFSLVGTLPPAVAREPLYAALVQVNPNNIPVQIRLVQVLAGRDLAQAQAYVNQVLALIQSNTSGNPNQTDLLFLQGQLAQAVGDRSRAEAAYTAILAVQPNNIDTLAALGGIRFQQRQFDSATQLYSQVLSLNPYNQSARISLAELATAQGNTFSGIQQLEQVQIQQTSTGMPSDDVSRKIQQMQEDLLRQRGFQPHWERYR